jgi:serine/threonine protein kinase
VIEAIDEMRADAPDIMQRIAMRILDAQQLKESGQMSAYLRHVCKLQTLSHPNLLRVFDFDQDEGRLFLTMELLSGSSLPQFVAPTASALQYRLDRRHVLRSVAGALQCAHAQGIAHGELRAEDIFITLSGDVRLMGLDGAFNRTSDDIAKDHLAFAWLVIDLLGDRSHPGQLRRPEGLTDSSGAPSKPSSLSRVRR